MGFLDKSKVSTSLSISAYFASLAIAILLDLIWLRSYFPLKSPHRLMRWAIFASSSRPVLSSRAALAVFCNYYIAEAKSLFLRNSLTITLSYFFYPLLFFLAHSLINLFFIFTRSFFRGMFPSLPMFKDITRPSILLYSASKFSSVIVSSVSRILKSSWLNWTTVYNGELVFFLKTLCSQFLVKWHVTDILIDESLPYPPHEEELMM